MFLKKFYILLLILYGFTPCTVKNTVFDVFSLDYAKPTNANKTTSSSSCTYLSSTKETAQSRTVKKLLNFEAVDRVSFIEQTISFSNLFIQHTSGRSPPLYILFQQLKLATFLQV